MERPALLEQHHESGASLIAAFDAASAPDRIATDKWLLWASCYGSMTWQEGCLKHYVDSLDEIA